MTPYPYFHKSLRPSMKPANAMYSNCRKVTLFKPSGTGVFLSYIPVAANLPTVQDMLDSMTHCQSKDIDWHDEWAAWSRPANTSRTESSSNLNPTYCRLVSFCTLSTNLLLFILSAATYTSDAAGPSFSTLSSNVAYSPEPEIVLFMPSS